MGWGGRRRGGGHTGLEAFGDPALKPLLFRPRSCLGHHLWAVLPSQRPLWMHTHTPAIQCQDSGSCNRMSV